MYSWLLPFLFADGGGSAATHLPVADHVSFIFDMAGMACNVQELLDWCTTILRELPNVEARLQAASSTLSRYFLYCKLLETRGTLGSTLSLKKEGLKMDSSLEKR